jgi:hypothetical protein
MTPSVNAPAGADDTIRRRGLEFDRTRGCDSTTKKPSDDSGVFSRARAARERFRRLRDY